MRNSIRALAVTSTVIAGLAAGPVPYAHGSNQSSGPMMGSGTMGQSGAAGSMGQMREMREGCKKMMQFTSRHGSGPPNEQWRGEMPNRDSAPDTNG